ncbi:hypothetical protein MUN81_04485 [Hymenobacter sp. 5317J-9]|uniref:hypothetical protein n=1 Tax=Hymenobacter sp. 5317J-9 TaxID=2932250 RepID=UPI001FD65790|nr:hypothetical protein [Hymenobacter sp. 5317J-9]UOQ98752.1 hypothetical protein MUN81_04485 [Hymenobacter sp. 5317J-9]
MYSKMRLGSLVFVLCALLGFHSPCSPQPFRTVFAPTLVITGVADAGSDCLPEYVSHVVCADHGRAFFRAPAGQEFEFSKRPWPRRLVLPALAGYQVLLERNNRPAKNDLLLLTVADGRVVRKQALPVLATVRDVDGDGQVEYGGILDYAEGLADPDKGTYNPLLFYEITPQGWALDTAATVGVNRKVWGKFYGYKARPQLVLKVSDASFARYLPKID